MSPKSTTLLTYDPSKGWTPHHGQHDIPALPALSPSQSSLRVASWNIWEDSRYHDIRHRFILDTLLLDSGGRHYDIVCLQEVTSDFFLAFLSHPKAREDWFITDLEEQFSLCANSYSSVVMIRREYGNRFKLTTAFLEFPNTIMARGFVIIEFRLGDRVILRVGTAHFESHPEDVRKRHRQFKIAADILATPGDMFIEGASPVNQNDDDQTIVVPAILAGDFNVQNYAELNCLLSEYSFHDGFLAARPIHESESPFLVYPTYGLTLTNRPRLFNFKASTPKRSDYVFVRGVKVEKGVDEAGFLGDEPVCALDVAQDEEGKDGRVWASDHLGIWVDVNLSLVLGEFAKDD